MSVHAAPTGRKVATLLCLLLLLTGCKAMNQVTFLDRVFEPERFGRTAAAPPASAPKLAPRRAPAPVRTAPAEPDVLNTEPRSDPATIQARHRPAPPAPEPESAEDRLRQAVRQEPWLTRFWSELSLTQQARIARQLPASENPPGVWDSMGLGDRARLIAAPSVDPGERRWASGQ